MADALTFALQERGSMCSTRLDVMENTTFLEKLKFGPGDGQLQYYLYNWTGQTGTQHTNSVYRPLLYHTASSHLSASSS